MVTKISKCAEFWIHSKIEEIFEIDLVFEDLIKE